MLHQNIIRQDQNLYSNSNPSILSKCGKYALVMQPDGNLVIYSGSHPSHHIPSNALWASNTDNKGRGPYRLVMQPDGNLVVYDQSNHATWAAGTDNKGIKGNYTAKFKNGQLMVLDCKKQILWTSGASKKEHLLHQSNQSCGPHTPVHPTPQPVYPSAYPSGGAYPPQPVPAYQGYVQPQPYQSQPGYPPHPTYPNKYY